MYVVLLNQVACVQMINALVTTPEDLDFRLHLRNEFVREGLYEAIQVRPILSHNFKHAVISVFYFEPYIHVYIVLCAFRTDHTVGYMYT